MMEKSRISVAVASGISKSFHISLHSKTLRSLRVHCAFALHSSSYFNVQCWTFDARQISAPLSRKNLSENPTADDILNAFLDYLTTTGTEPYDH